MDPQEHNNPNKTALVKILGEKETFNKSTIKIDLKKLLDTETRK